MDRREFIKKSGVAAAGALLLSTPFASILAKDDKNKKVRSSESHPSLLEDGRVVTDEGKAKGMKIVVLTGSPRKNGNTNHMADEFIRGAKEAGHEVFRFNTATSEVHPCLGCNHCGMDGPCVYDDDFTKVLRPEIIKADLVVFCSPMYYFGFSAQLKTTIDRFYAINGTLHTHKKCAFLMAYANMSKKDAEAMTAHYKTIADYMGWEDVGSVIAPGIWTAGSIKGTKFAKESYELGKSL